MYRSHHRKSRHRLAVSAWLVLAVGAVQAGAPLPSHPPCAIESGAEACRVDTMETPRTNGRFGIGYEARREFDTGSHGDRGGRIERPERINRMERSGRGR